MLEILVDKIENLKRDYFIAEDNCDPAKMKEIKAKIKELEEQLNNEGRY